VESNPYSRPSAKEELKKASSILNCIYQYKPIKINKERKSMKTTGLLIVLIAAFAVALVGCKKGGGGATPEDAVKGMMEAAKAKNWEKAVSYMDVESMVEQAKKQVATMTKDMSAEDKKKMEDQMGDMLDAKKMRSKMVEEMKKEDKAPTSYKILEVKNKTDNSAIVVVETTEGKETKKDEIPVKKVGNKWMIGFGGEAGIGEPPVTEPPVTEPPVIEEKKEEVPPTDVKEPKEGEEE
jgi:hypothetical protein